MPGLNLISGNRLEALAQRCGSLFQEEPLPPMNKEIIVLQSMGMMQWLSIRLAEKLGIWADFEYVLPNRMTGLLMKSFFPGLGDERFFDRDIMTWKALKLLRESRDPVYGDLRDYSRGDSSGIREYQVSSRITDLFDQYMTFRPDMILRWDRGEYGADDGWQPHLWRELTAGMGGVHPPALLDRLFTGIAEGSVTRPSDLPRRISVFGVSYLPLYHLNVLRAASVFCDVYLYMLNPCREFWVDVMREKEITGIVSRKPIIAKDFEEELHIERGNGLLSSMGRAGRDFLRFLYMAGEGAMEEELFDEPEPDSLLHIIQGDILTMTCRGAKGSAEVVRLSDKVLSEDRSVVVNSCHSVMREVEVLHDYLLDLFSGTDGLTPGDVLVMTPDIESFSSVIQGVFDRREEGIPEIPYRIVDRNIGNTSRAVDIFMKILSLPDGRFTSAEVMGIFQCPDVLRKFGLTEDDCAGIGAWVREAGIFWGIDARHREELDLPGISENTWSFGIERMLMGAVMACDEPVLDILPLPGIEGKEMQVLGRFITFLGQLSDTYYDLLKEHTPAEWSAVMSGIAGIFFETDEVSSGDMLQVEKAAARLMEIGTVADFTGRVGLLPVKEYMERSISTASAGRNFITGSLTFCEMLPMRSIPCRVICLIGMNEYSFPRKSRPPVFDLMMKKPRMGDRSVRDEDRYLFLETLISARERIYISYTGQNVTTGTDQNPSIVVSELMDYIGESFAVESGGRVGEFIFRKQRIQPYHPVYFTKGSGYYSYSPGRMAGALSYLTGSGEEYGFYTGKLPPLTGEEKNITAEELADFLINPARYMLRRRLGLNLEYYSEDYTEDEPFIPGGLEKYGLDDRVFRYLAEDLRDEDIFMRVRAEGVLPHGSVGTVVFDESLKRAKDIFSRVKPLLVNRSIAEHEIKIGEFDIRLKCPVYDGKFVFFRPGKLRPADRMKGWICHLVACGTGAYGGEFRTRFVAADGSAVYKFAGGSRDELEPLLALYERGMTEPLPLFPTASYEFAASLAGKERDKALDAAAKKFRNSYGKSDVDDPYIVKLFGENYRLDEEFTDLAKRVYSPMIDHKEGSDGEI